MLKSFYVSNYRNPATLIQVFFLQLVQNLEKGSGGPEGLFPKGFVEIAGPAGEDLDEGLGLVAERGPDEAIFDRNAIEGRQGSRNQIVIRPEAARYRDDGTDRPHHHQEKCIGHCEGVETGKPPLHRPKDGAAGHPVADPDQEGI